MKKISNHLPYIIFALLLGLLIGLKINDVVSFSEKSKQLKKIGDIMEFTEDYYVDKVDEQKLTEDAIKGMFSNLDPHTVYISAKDQTAEEESFRGNFEGIGVEFQIINDTITVVSPITGGPSEMVGIISGDRIVKIDGKNSTGWKNEDVIKKLRGNKGTNVDLTIFRPSSKSVTTFKVTRDKINLFSVDASLMYDNETGYINLTRFSETTTEEMVNALNDLASKGMKRLVLDLRNNPGGYERQASNVADLFIDGDKMIVYNKGRLKQSSEEYHAGKTYPYEKIPLIILVNRGSASASEIVSGAIQDWDRGLIIGETTFGKGLVQTPIQLKDGSAVRITIAKYFTPSGRQIQRDYKDKNKYYEEVMDRQETEGDNVDHKTEKDSSKPKFKTKNGRTVYGGGGITPDYIVEPGKVSNYSLELRKNNVYYQFVRKILDKEGSALREKYSGNLQKFANEFQISNEQMQNFVKYAESLKVKYDAKGYEADKESIRQRLKAFIARDLYKNNGWYLTLLKSDHQFQKAASLFGEAEKLAGFSK
ncbi:MAG: S41 family peptidase [Melioribacter sp.]|nr:S41 family peptidase [Melioribacter sp.]